MGQCRVPVRLIGLYFEELLVNMDIETPKTKALLQKTNVYKIYKGAMQVPLGDIGGQWTWTLTFDARNKFIRNLTRG